MRKRLQRIYHNMNNRCYNKNDWSHYKRYGAKGIKVCEEWRHNFKAFYDWSMDNGYDNHLTLDRIDINGDYSPSNCRWATVLEQNNNRSSCIYIEYDGRKQTLAQWSRERGINYHTLRTRLENGWSVERSLDYEKI